MKKIYLAFLALFLPVVSGFNSNTEKTEVVTTYEYNFTLKVKVPRIYDNNQSLGYRKYKSQTIKGIMKISYRENGKFLIRIEDLVNKSHKINGRNITYKVSVDNEGNTVFPRITFVGNNRTEVFKVPGIMFFMDAEPSYNIGEDNEDNSLLLFLSATGTSKAFDCGRYIKSFSGYATGTLGCGCFAYGHKSPTRVAGACGATDKVTDIAPVTGRWTAKISKNYCEELVFEDE